MFHVRSEIWLIKAIINNKIYVSVTQAIFFPRRILKEHGLVRYHSKVKSPVYASVSRPSLRTNLLRG